MKWQKEKKYVRFLTQYPHYQVDKFNGTKGNCEMMPNNIGVFKEATKTYVFKPVKDPYTKEYLTPEFIEGLLLQVEGKMVEFYGSHFTVMNDQDEKEITERFEVRLIKATSQIDVNMAKMYYEAAQINRLSIKHSLAKLGLHESKNIHP